MTVLSAAPARPLTTAAGLARRFTDDRLCGVESAVATLTGRYYRTLPAQRRVELTARATIDMDSTDVEVYGPRKQGMAYNYAGQRSLPVQPDHAVPRPTVGTGPRRTTTGSPKRPRSRCLIGPIPRSRVRDQVQLARELGDRPRHPTSRSGRVRDTDPDPLGRAADDDVQLFTDKVLLPD